MRKTKRIFSNAYILLVFMFLFAPIAVLIAFSFNASKGWNWTGFTTEWYAKLFTNKEIITSLMYTLGIAFVAAIVSTILGTAAAIGIYNMKKGYRKIVLNVSYMPILNPEIVTGISLLLLFNFMGIDLGIWSLIISHITFCVPYVLLSVLPKLRQMDPSLYEAALDLGCNPYQAFWKVTIPEIMPGVLTGGLMALTYSIDDFVISYFTAGSSVQTLPVAISSMVKRRVSPEINALSAIMFVVVFLILLAMNIREYSKEKKARINKRVGEKRI